jgi:hypothetical protein
MYWKTDFKDRMRFSEMFKWADKTKRPKYFCNKVYKAEIRHSIKMVKKYDESFGTLLFSPSCTNLRMSPFEEACTYYAGICTKGYTPSRVEIPKECEFRGRF